MPLQDTMMKCPGCNAAVPFKSAPPRIDNRLYASTVTIDHPQFSTCKECGKVLTLAIMAVENMLVTAIEVPLAEQPRVLVTGGIA